MPLKEYLVKKLSLKLNKSERIIDAVISNQFITAYQATAHYNSIEISGFAKFTFSQLKAKKCMDKYLALQASYNAILADPNSSKELVRTTTLKLATVTKNIEHLKPKMR